MELWCSLGSVNLNLDSNFTMERRPPRTNEVTGPKSANRQPILIKLWILHLMTHSNKLHFFYKKRTLEALNIYYYLKFCSS